MFPARNGIAFGVSSEPDTPSSLILWLDNQTDKSEDFYFCCASTLFEHIDIFDSQGHRILSKTDHIELKARSEGHEVLQVCTCSGSLAVPAHTIQMFDFADLSLGYDLPPGQYVISERNPPAVYNLDADKHEGSHHAPLGLAILFQ